MAYVYVCIYSHENDCLLFAKKKKRGMFFNGKVSGDSKGTILNYSGQHVLPGGYTKVKDVTNQSIIEAEALREFAEETGCQLQPNIMEREIKSFNNAGAVITKGWAAFHCLYIRSTAEQIATLKQNITLCLSKPPHQRFDSGMDDELEKVTVKTISHARERLITFVKESADPDYGEKEQDKSWFGYIVDNLHA